ncbi:MAG: alanine racemase [Gammaproteobacteria bacterium]|nr:alanine racemase [Gammaproteobacteria bacterium]
MSRAVRAIIDLAALTHNWDKVREFAPRSKVLAVVKADAYGHGSVHTAGALTAADGFGVAGIDEALTLREAGVTVPICLLSGFHEPADLSLMARHAIGAAVYDPAQLDALDAARLHRPVTVWLKIDSGMHRLGFAPEQVAGAVARLESAPAVGDLRLMSHLANADNTDDDYTRTQLKCFLNTSRNYRYPCSIANSAAVMAWPDTHLDWIRPGLMLYGASPLLGRSAAELALKPVMTLTASIIAVKHLNAGDPIGYGGDWVCPTAMRVGVVACGYGDGYPRHAPSGAPVWIQDCTAPLIGRVSMDLISVDLSHHPHAGVGTPVELWGEHLPVDTVASHAGTIAYELLCGVTARVPRQVLA